MDRELRTADIDAPFSRRHALRSGQHVVPRVGDVVLVQEGDLPWCPIPWRGRVTGMSRGLVTHAVPIDYEEFLAWAFSYAERKERGIDVG